MEYQKVIRHFSSPYASFGVIFILLLALLAIYSTNIFVGSPSAGTLVFASGPSVTLSSSLNPSSYGQSVTFKAKISSALNGENINFKDGSNTIGTSIISGGFATITLSTLSATLHTMTASYPGDANNQPSTSSAVLQLVKPVSTATTLTSNQISSTYGQAVTFTATITSSGGTVPNGDIVNFKDGSTIIASNAVVSGSASISTNALAPGLHSITAVYSGDTNFTSSTSSVVLQGVKGSSSSSTTIAPPSCGIGLNISSGSPYYVEPQKIAIFYTTKKLGSCNIVSAQGTLTLSGATTGVVYSSTVINFTNVQSNPITSVIYLNSSGAENGGNLAVFVINSGSISNITSTNFYVLQPANITIANIQAIPNLTQVGEPISIRSNIFNNALYDAKNATVNIKIIAPNSTVYRLKQYVGRIPAFQNATFVLNPGISGVPESIGKYIVLENISYYSIFSTANAVYSSSVLYSNTSTVTYTSHINNNAGYTPSLGYPSEPASVGSALISAFPYYTDLLSGKTYSNLDDFIITDSGNFPIIVNLTVPSLPFGNLTLSSKSLTILPSQNATVQMIFKPNSGAIGTYVIPINITSASLSNFTRSQLYTIVNLDNKSTSLQVLGDISLFNGNKNANVTIDISNPTNVTNYDTALSTKLGTSVSTSKNSITLYGTGANLSISNNTYYMHWLIGQLNANATSEVVYRINNLSQTKSILLPSTLLTSTTQANFTSLIILSIKKPTVVYPNTTTNITISAIYVGTNITTLNITLLPPPTGATILNSHTRFRVVPNSPVVATFIINTGSFIGNETFKLVTPGRFTSQIQYITISVTPKPVYTLSQYLSDPRTIFGLATLGLYILSLVYGRAKIVYKNRKIARARTNIKKFEELRNLGKRIGEAILTEGATKRVFKRHINKDESQGGFVEESAIVGKDVIVASTAVVEDETIVSGEAQILDKATISDHAVVRSKVIVSGNAKIGDNAEVYGSAKIYGSAKLFGECEVYDRAEVYGNAEVFGDSIIYGEARILGTAKVYGTAKISGDAKISRKNIQKGDIVSGTR